MAIYMISYDLHAPTNNREKVEEDIKSLGSWCKYLTTTFLVSSDKSFDDAQAVAIKHLDSNDRMEFCTVQKPIGGWLSPEQWKWIKENL